MSMGTGDRNQSTSGDQYTRESQIGRTSATTPTGTHSEYEAEYDNTTSRTGNGGASTPEISADIEHTRRKMGRRIDQIQAKLDPDRLMGEAQNAVQNVLSDTASSITDYVRENRDTITQSITSAARRNPLPTALVGLGLGWLLLESLGGGSSSNSRRRQWEDDRQRSARFRAQRESRSMYSDAYSDAYDDSFDDVDYASRSYGASNYGSSTYGSSGYSAGSGYSSGSGSYSPGQYQRSAEQNWGNQPVNRDAYGNAYDPSRERYSGGSSESGSGPIAKAKDAISHVAETVKGQVEGVVETVQDKVEGVVGTVQDKAGDLQQQAQYQAGQLQHQAGHMGDRMGEQWSNTGQRFQQTGRRMRQMSRRRGRQFQAGLEDNPLTYAALALVAGAAVAYILPQTRMENQAMGQWRDQLMDDADEMMHEARQRAQRVVEEVRPEFEQSARALGQELKQTAQEIGQRATESAKEIGQRAAEEINPVVERAREAAKDEARQAAAERGIGQKNQSQGTSGQGSSSGSMSGQGSSTSNLSSTTQTGSTSGMGTSSMGTSGQTGSGQSSTGQGSQGAAAQKSSTSTMGTSTPGMSTQNKTSAGTPTIGSSMSGQGSTQLGATIDKSKLQSRWSELRTPAQQRWSKLSGENLTDATYDKLVTALKQQYSYTQTEAEREVDEFLRQHMK